MASSSLEVGNYRPISVLPCVSKILEKCVYNQLQKYLLDNNIIYDYQSGFRPQHSTDTCLIYLTDWIKTEISKGKYVGMLLLDVQKAFDCVNHEILLKKLKAIGIDPTWFSSYLSNRKQCVMINGVVSGARDITCGVPQGGLLAPLLYLCYNNDMEISVDSKLLLYADDSVLLVSDRDPNIVSKKLKSDLISCNQWFSENKLSMHVGKTECILFGSKRNLSKIKEFKIEYNGCTIKGQSTVKYLGVILDQTLSGDHMAKSASQK